MSKSRPNLLFILLDHQLFCGHDRPGVFTYRHPRFEAFAAQGTRFDRAYCVTPLCTPARASMMTGVYPSAHGLIRNTDYHPMHDFRQGQLLYSHFLARAGYRNAYIGKWHCGRDRLPIDYGIEGWALPDYGKVYMSPQYEAYAAARGLGDARAHIEHYLDRPHFVGSTQVLHHNSPWYFMQGAGVLEGPPEAHESQFVAHETIGKLRELAAAGDSQPWSLVASFWAPHQPYYPTEPFASMVDPASIPEYPSWRDDLAGRPTRHLLHRNACAPSASTWTDWPTWQRVLGRAYGQGYQTDAAVGEILDALGELGLAEDTLVIWTADHGDALASHGGVFDKMAGFTEEVARVPMAIRWPGHIEPGRRTDARVSNMDVPATMLDAAGAQVPANWDSRSLLAPARSDTSTWPDQLICQHYGHGAIHLVQRVILADRYKYVAVDFDGDEMYDLAADPYEMHNRIDDPAHADVRNDLRRRLLEHIQRTDDRDARRIAVRLQAGR